MRSRQIKGEKTNKQTNIHTYGETNKQTNIHTYKHTHTHKQTKQWYLNLNIQGL